MSVKPTLNQKQRDLIRRYFVWCYKTTKEDLDRIDRYYTQLIADGHVLKSLRGSKEYQSSKPLRKMIDDFNVYMKTKKSNVDKKKFLDVKSKKLNPDYQYLNLRFFALEKAISHFLGKKELDNIRRLYEEEMTERILKTREHT